MYVGLLNYDEALLAGGTSADKNYYLVNGLSNTSSYWWTISPYDYENNFDRMGVVREAGHIYHWAGVSDNTIYYRPTITIKSDMNYISGDGKKSSPYIITVN